MMQKGQTNKRIETFDLMRGFFVLVIIIDHLQRWPGIFDWITGQGRLWVSAAEGFILISGIMIGLVRGRKNIQLPIKEVAKKLWKRAALLYFCAIFAAIATLGIVTIWHTNFTPYPPGIDSYSAPTFLGKIYETFTLRGTFGWSVFLMQYAVYLFVAPLFIYMLRKGLWWVGLLASAAVWLYGFGNNQYLLSWQFLFYIGATIGFYYHSIQNKWQSFAYHKQITSAAIVFAAISLASSVFVIFGWPIVKQSWSPITYEAMLQWRTVIDPLFTRSELLPLHLIITLLWFYTLYSVFVRYDSTIKKYFGWLLLRFGQNSLPIYVTQGFVVVFISGTLPTTNSILMNSMIISATILFIWWMTTKFKQINTYLSKQRIAITSSALNQDQDCEQKILFGGSTVPTDN